MLLGFPFRRAIVPAVFMLGLGLFALLALPARASLPRKVGPFSLGQPRDSALAAAPQSGYSLFRDLGHELDWTPADSTSALVSAEIERGRIQSLRLSYPSVPTAGEFEEMSVQYQSRYGEPSQVFGGDSARKLVWEDRSTRVVLQAGFYPVVGIPFEARMLDLSSGSPPGSAAAARKSGGARRKSPRVRRGAPAGARTASK